MYFVSSIGAYNVRQSGNLRVSRTVLRRTDLLFYGRNGVNSAEVEKGRLWSFRRSYSVGEGIVVRGRGGDYGDDGLVGGAKCVWYRGILACVCAYVPQ